MASTVVASALLHARDPGGNLNVTLGEKVTAVGASAADRSMHEGWREGMEGRR